MYFNIACFIEEKMAYQLMVNIIEPPHGKTNNVVSERV